MPLTGPQLGRIHQAILAAYERDELQRVLLTCMNVDFDHVVAPDDFSAQVFALVRWADRQKRARELVRCLHEDRPADAELAALHAEAQGWVANAAAIPASAPGAAPLTVEPAPGSAPVPAPAKGATSRSRWLVAAAIVALIALFAYATPQLMRWDARAPQTAASTADAPQDATAAPVNTPAPAADVRSPAEGAETWAEPFSGMTFVRIPAGEFTMGSTEAQAGAALELCREKTDVCTRTDFYDEIPQHRVTLGEYWIGQTEVTNAQFRAFVEDGGYTDRALWTEAGWQWRAEFEIAQPRCWDDPQAELRDHPVICVSWHEAVAYAHWLGRATGLEFRLPSEAEWEKAARGTDGRTWPWGEQLPDADRANSRNMVGRTSRVGSFPGGATSYGVLDMAGNVWEWTASLYEPYPYSADDGREVPDVNGLRTDRGGSYADLDVNVRGANRAALDPRDRNEYGGFRLAVRQVPLPTGTGSPTPPTPAAPAIDAVVHTPTPQAIAPTGTPTQTPRDTPTAMPTDTAVATPANVPPPQPADAWSEPLTGMAFVRVPAGEFTMGSSQAQVDAALRLCEATGDNCPARQFEEETPQHQVTLDDYWIGRTEVTNGQFRAFVAGGGYADQSLWTEAGWQWRTENDVTQPGCWDDPEGFLRDYPVVCVSWYEAVAYANWLTREAGREFRLPSEAEWEKAACGTDGRAWPWGDEPPDVERANFNREVGGTTPAGSYPADASPTGALDMAGNVTEWTASLYGPYPYAADDGRESQAGSSHRALRGGSFISLGHLLRCAARGGIPPGDRYEQVGFRLVSPGG